MENIVLTLAAMAQAIDQVQKVAWKGQMDDAEAMPLINSIFNLDAESVVELYSGTANLSTGLRTLRAQLDPGSAKKNTEFGRYMANLFTIQKQFMSHQDIQNVLTSRIEHTKRLLDYEDILSANVIASLADCYSQSISNLALRIQVHGDPQILQNKANQDKIRALLLAAVRAAVLWRQVGGKKRQFLFNRKRLLETSQRLLTQPIYE